MNDEQPRIGGGCVVPSTAIVAQAPPGSSSYRERPDDIRLVVHSYDICKGNFHSRSTRDPLWVIALSPHLRMDNPCVIYRCLQSPKRSGGAATMQADSPALRNGGR